MLPCIQQGDLAEIGQEVSAARTGFPAQRSVFQGAISSVFSGNLQCAPSSGRNTLCCSERWS